MGFKDDTYRKLLGLEGIDDTGLSSDKPGGKPWEGGAAKSYFDRPAGDFSGGVPYNMEDSNAVMYRSPDQDIEQSQYETQKGFARGMYALGRLIGTTGTKLGAGLSYVEALAQNSM